MVVSLSLSLSKQGSEIGGGCSDIIGSDNDTIGGKQFLTLLEKLCSISSRVIVVTHQSQSSTSMEKTQTGFIEADLKGMTPSRWLVTGAVQSARLEYPQVMMSVVYSDSEGIEDAVRVELSEHYNSEELEIAYVNGERLVRRYYESQKVGSAMELVLTDRGLLENLHIGHQIELAEPGDNEVEVSVRAVSLNFRDVLNVLGMYPGDPGLPGCEFAGVVRRVGRLVSDLQEGDEVIGMGTGCLKSYVTAHRSLVHLKPSCLSYEESASLPIVYCTVELGLRDLACLKKDETILIHAAAGGVGLAAIQFAQQVGARVIASASEGKHALLRSMGVELITSSRDSSQFELDIKRIISDIGKIDVVLNSLSDDFIPLSLDSLGPCGRFVEIGKRGIWSSDEVEARAPGIGYHVVALDTLSAEEPEYVQSLLHRVCTDFDRDLLYSKKL